jgi:hypothetical protein
MDVDIRKAVSHDFGIHRQEQSATTSTSDFENDLDSDDDDYLPDDPKNGTSAPAPSAGASSQALGSNGVVAADIEDQTIDQPAEIEAYPIYDSDEEYDENYVLEEARRIGGWHYYKTLASWQARKFKRGVHSIARRFIRAQEGSSIPRREVQQSLIGSADIQSKKLKAPHGKKIQVPVRVEPKVYFAAERTFLGWVKQSRRLLILVVKRGLTPCHSSNFPSTLGPWPSRY